MIAGQIRACFRARSRSALDLIQIHLRKPALVNVLADLGAARPFKKDRLFTDVLGEPLVETCMKLRREYKPRSGALEANIKKPEQQASMESRFAELERLRNGSRPAWAGAVGRDERDTRTMRIVSAR